jgi:hypothetical protein
MSGFPGDRWLVQHDVPGTGDSQHFVQPLPQFGISTALVVEQGLTRLRIGRYQGGREQVLNHFEGTGCAACAHRGM